MLIFAPNFNMRVLISRRVNAFTLKQSVQTLLPSANTFRAVPQSRAFLSMKILPGNNLFDSLIKLSINSAVNLIIFTWRSRSLIKNFSFLRYFSLKFLLKFLFKLLYLNFYLIFIWIHFNFHLFPFLFKSLYVKFFVNFYLTLI